MASADLFVPLTVGAAILRTISLFRQANGVLLCIGVLSVLPVALLFPLHLLSLWLLNKPTSVSFADMLENPYALVIQYAKNEAVGLFAVHGTNVLQSILRALPQAMAVFAVVSIYAGDSSSANLSLKLPQTCWRRLLYTTILAHGGLGLTTCILTWIVGVLGVAKLGLLSVPAALIGFPARVYYMDTVLFILMPNIVVSSRYDLTSVWDLVSQNRLFVFNIVALQGAVSWTWSVIAEDNIGLYGGMVILGGVLSFPLYNVYVHWEASMECVVSSSSHNNNCEIVSPRSCI